MLKKNVLNDTANFDTTNKANGYVLQYDSSVGKFTSKPLPSGIGSTIICEDWAGETVYVFDNIPPLNITKLNVTYLAQTSLTLNWTESTSVDTHDYLIYNGSTLITTVLATTSKLQQLMYQVTGLSASTNYTFTVKTRDVQGNISSGVGVIIKTYGIQALSMNGISDYIKLPSMTFTTIELTCVTTPLSGNTASGYMYVDARSGVSTAFFSINNNGFIQYGSPWTTVLVDGIALPDNDAIKSISTKFTLTLGLSSQGTDDINIFSNYQNTPAMSGKIYSIRVLNGNNLIASYDLTSQFAGTSIVDTSGNGRTATLTGGTWVTG